MCWRIICPNYAGHGRRFMASPNNLAQANERGRELQARIPRVVSAKFDRKIKRIVVQLSSRLIVSFSPEDVEGLQEARPADLSAIEISPSGFGLHFPALDADIYVPALL